MALARPANSPENLLKLFERYMFKYFEGQNMIVLLREFVRDDVCNNVGVFVRIKIQRSHQNSLAAKVVGCEARAHADLEDAIAAGDDSFHQLLLLPVQAPVVFGLQTMDPVGGVSVGRTVNDGFLFICRAVSCVSAGHGAREGNEYWELRNRAIVLGVVVYNE